MKIRGYVALSSMFLIGSAMAADVWSKKSVAGPDLLPADMAFQLVSAQRDGDNVKLDWVIAPGYYLYRKRLSFEPVQPAQAHIGAAQLPKGENIHDEHFGDTEIYRETLQAKLPLTKGAPAVQQLRVRYQGCADAGVCYPPVTRVIDVAAAPR